MTHNDKNDNQLKEEIELVERIDMWMFILLVLSVISMVVAVFCSCSPLTAQTPQLAIALNALEKINSDEVLK